jgi:hypothetical protein
MLLSELQQFLEELYQLDIEPDIYDFLVTDRFYLDEVVDSNTPHSDEMLLVRDADDSAASSGERPAENTVDVALYLDAQVLDRLANTNPSANLHANNLNDFCTVLEGVSHFMYLAWNAVQNRQITQLELEVQAEIDKYISARMLLESQANSRLAAVILPALFESVVYRADLPPDRLQRYQQANQFAARYCYSLQQRFPAAQVSASMVHELRDVYRMPQRDMLSHLQAVQYA